MRVFTHSRAVTRTRKALRKLRRRQMATARFTLVALLALGIVVSGAQTAQAVDAVNLTLSTTTVNAGSTVDLKASMPVVGAGTTTQSISQTIDPAKTKLTGPSDITYPSGWNLEYSTDGTTYSSSTPTDWSLVKSVKTTGPVVSQGVDSGKQVNVGTGNSNLVPPTGQFLGYASGRDPWTVQFDDDGRILVMPHHAGASGAMCFNRDGTKCVGWADSGGNWLTNDSTLNSSHAAGSWIDTTNNLWWYTSITAGTIGCLDITPGQLPHNCNLTGLTGGKIVSPACAATVTCTARAYGALSNPAVIGNRFFTMTNYGAVLCFQVSATAVSACTGSNYVQGSTVAPGYNTNSEPQYPVTLAANGKLFTYNYKTTNANDGYLSCIEPLTGALCAGWTVPSSVTANTAEGLAQDVFTYPDANGNFKAICASYASTAPYVVCKNGDGTAFTPPTAFVDAVRTYGTTSAWSNGFLTAGTKIYLHNGDGSTQTPITCFDTVTQAACAGYTTFSIYNYTVVADPLNPECLWSIGDTGGIIKTFSATTGGSCTTKAAGVTFNVNTVVPRMGCSSTSAITGWRSFTLTSPSTGSYTSATVKVVKADGTTAYTHSLSGGTADLSSDLIADTGQNPTFLVEFVGLTGTGTASASVVAVGDAPELCLRATAVYPCPTALGPVGTLGGASAAVTAGGTAVAGGSTTTLTSSTQNVSISPPAASSCGSTLTGRAGDAGNGGTGTAISGVTVTLLDSSGNPIMRNGSAVTTTTDSSGNYSFGALTAGSYKVRFETSSGKTLESSTTVSGATGTTAGAATTPVISCTGGGTTQAISGANANLKAVTSASLLTRSSNIVTNGDFTNRPSVSDLVFANNRSASYTGGYGITSYSWGANTSYGAVAWGPVTGWTASGGGTGTYSLWVDSSTDSTRFPHSDADLAGSSSSVVYFGNGSSWSISPTRSFDANGYSSTAYTFSTSNAIYGNSTGQSLAQILPTQAGKTYRLQFWVGREVYSGLNSSDGIAAINISTLGRVYFKVPKDQNVRYTLEFVAPTSSTEIKYTSWGHLGTSTELVLDDVIVNACSNAATVDSGSAVISLGTAAVVNALFTVPASASSDTSTGAWDTNQTISPLSNDVASSGTTLTPSSVKLCASNETAPNCTLSSLTVPGEGTYTVNANGTVTFDPLPTFNGTATAVNYQVSDSASNVVSSSFQATVSAPVPSSASADTTTGVKGATQTVTPQSNDTPGSGITFTNSSVKLCAVGVLPPNCSATSLTNSAGTYTVNASTGVITFTPDPSFTGVAPAMTYQVSDSSGQTVSSTYTATVTGVPSTDNETTSGSWNQSQTISLINGDAAGYGTTLTASSVKLCGPSDTSPNCSLTTLTVANVGTYVVDASGNVTFTPVASFTGTAAAITYSVTDSLNQKATGTYTATVSSPAAPTANPEQKAVLPGGTATFTATISGSTPLASGSQLKTGASGGPAFVCPVTGATSCSATSVVVPGEGTWTMNQTTGVATFAADNAAPSGTLTAVTYRVTDVTGQTATATLTPVVPPAPTAAADTSRGAQDTTQFLAILGNDAPGSAAADLAPGSVKLCGVSETAPNCTLTSKTVAGEGTYTVLSNGVVKFVPVSGYHGTATAQSYQVADNLGQVVSSTLQVVVVPPPFPLANVDTGTAAYGQTVTLRPWLNDAGGVVPAGETAPAPDVVASSIKLCAVGQIAPNCSATTVTTDDGTYVLNTSTGEVVFTPVAGFSGTVTSPVTYQITNNWTGLAGPGTATSLLMPTIAPPGSPLALNDSAQTAPMTPVTVTPVTNDVNGTGTLVATSIKLCDATEIAPACTQTSVTVREGVFSVNVATGDVTFTPNSLFDVEHPAVVTYAIKDSLNLWTNATITITDPPPASVVNQITNLARTGASTFGGPLPLTAFVALVGGVSVVFFAHKSRLKPGTAFMKLEFSDSYRKLQSSLEKPVVSALADRDAFSEGTEKIYRYVDGRPD